MARKNKLIRPYDETNWTLSDSTLYRCIRRVNRNHLIIALVILLLVMVLDTGVTFSKYMHFWRGPVRISAENLTAEEVTGQIRYVGFPVTVERSEEYNRNPMLIRSALLYKGMAYLELTGDGFTDSGIAPKSVNTGSVNNPLITDRDAAYTGEETYVKYQLLEIGERYLITKTPLGAYPTNLRGMITHLPEDMKGEVIRASGVDGDLILPLFFDATGEAFAHGFTDFGFSILLLVLWLPYFIYVVRRIRRYEVNPLYRQVFIMSGPVEDNARALDRELGGPGCYGTNRRTVTPSWIITQKLLSAEIRQKER